METTLEKCRYKKKGARDIGYEDMAHYMYRINNEISVKLRN